MDRITATEISVRAVDSGSFSGVAKQPSFGKLAIVKAVAKFEDRPGGRPLMRSAHCPETTAAGRTFAFGAFRLFPPERLLKKGEETLSVGGRALDILIALVERAGEVVTQEQISRVWPYVTVEETNLRVRICHCSGPTAARSDDDMQLFGNASVKTAVGLRRAEKMRTAESVSSACRHRAIRFVDRRWLPSRVAFARSFQARVAFKPTIS